MQGFLSTPSARRATVKDVIDLAVAEHFYPRPPRGGRPAHILNHRQYLVFLSTPSARRATTRRIQWPAQLYDISIHALREEGDGVA